MESSFPLWTIPLLPLIGAVINGGLSLAGARSKLGPSRGFVALIAVLAPFISFVLVCLASQQLSPDTGYRLNQTLWTWFATNDLHVDLNLLFDRLTSMMLLFVTGIGTLIHLYSVGYMWADRGFARFMAYMNLFMFSMIALVIGGSLPVTFLGWEGVGLCSYLLIGFWHRTTEYNDAARKAFLMNRIGDLGFLIGAFALVNVCGSMDYHVIDTWFANGANLKTLVAGSPAMATLSAAGLLIFLGCTGKSAQIPLLTWLPDAMAGPTPVSALIHAATMVTSGVYLVARLATLYAHCSPHVLEIILIIGCLTAVFGAVAGLFQNDIKKAFAYSTVSQLGYMFMAAGAGAHDVALFHVFTHAFFKATLFLGAGAIIHALHHEQDMRKMGGLHELRVHGRRPLYFTYAMLCFGWYAILGLPLGSGFFSKDLIIERVFGDQATLLGMQLGPAIGIIALLTAGVTAVYMTRVMVLTFWSPSRVSDEVKAHVEPTPITMAVPLLILGAGSLMVGWLWAPWAHHLVGTPFASYLAPTLHPALASQLHAEGMPAVPAMAEPHESLSDSLVITAIALLLALAGILFAFYRWRRGPTGPSVEAQPSTDPTGFGAAWTWAFDRVYAVVGVLVRYISLILYWVVDRTIIGGSSWLVGELSTFLGDGYAATQRSRLRVSLALSVLGAAAVIWIVPITNCVTTVCGWLARAKQGLY